MSVVVSTTAATSGVRRKPHVSWYFSTKPRCCATTSVQSAAISVHPMYKHSVRVAYAIPSTLGTVVPYVVRYTAVLAIAHAYVVCCVACTNTKVALVITNTHVVHAYTRTHLV